MGGSTIGNPAVDLFYLCTCQEATFQIAPVEEKHISESVGNSEREYMFFLPLGQYVPRFASSCALSPRCRCQCDVWIATLFVGCNFGWVCRGRTQVRRARNGALRFPRVRSATDRRGAVVLAQWCDGWLGIVVDHVGVLLWGLGRS